MTDDTKPTPPVAEVERKAWPLEHVEKVSTEVAMSQWERSLSRPDLSEKDRVRGAIEAYKRQAFAFAIFPASPSAPVTTPEGWRQIRKAVIERDGHEITDMGNGSWRLASPGRCTYQWFTSLEAALSASPSPVDSRDALIERLVDDLAMIVRKLVRYVPETVEFRAQALDYLRRHDLMGSPLRATTAAKEQQS